METAQPAYKQPTTPPPTKEEVREQNLYSSGYVSIFFKNFIAGLGKTLGSLILYLIFLYFAFQYFQANLMPQLQPLLKAFESINTLTEQTEKIQQQAPQINPDQLNNLLEQIKR